MAMRDLFSVTVAGEILLVLGFLMSFEWGFGVVFELVVGADKLFGAAADKLPVAVVDKLEVDILAVNRLVAASLAGKCCGKHVFLAATADWVMMIMMMLIDTANFGNDLCFLNYCVIVVVDKLHDCQLNDGSWKLGLPEFGADFYGNVSNFARFEDLGFQIPEIPKSGGGGSDQSPDGINNRELNPSKYTLYGPNNSAFLCLLWKRNCPNIDVMFDVIAPIGNSFVDVEIES
ncbi:hypothetical protein G9A89_022165 [Geosiphon pyriformis]|nr:hypothetical protein G9A89_022165 [Geosiphon pyriformis]